jgi:cell division protein FtsL
MSATEKIPLPKTNKAIVVIVSIAIVAVISGLMTPLYLQNRINRLYAKYNELTDEAVFLESDVLRLELKINQLSTLEHLRGYAEQSGLDLNTVPVKIMGKGGANER